MNTTIEELRALQSEYIKSKEETKRIEHARNMEIMRLRFQDKMSLASIGKKYGLSRQRVHQITSVPL